MMVVPFTKMHGAGNDFLMIDGATVPAGLLTADRIAAWCDRRLGVGGDGLIVLDRDPEPGLQYRMSYYNSDGGEAEMCGNGARCSVAFAARLGWIRKQCRFQTARGPLDGLLISESGGTAEVEVSLPAWRDLELDIAVPESLRPEHHSCNTGVPHVVMPVEDLEGVAVPEEGPPIRYAEQFAPDGTNVNWIAPTGETTDDGLSLWAIRTYERGVEAETLACGTGASAAAVILCHLQRARSPVALRTRSGDLLRITVDIEAGQLLLRGPAVVAFEGAVTTHD